MARKGQERVVLRHSLLLLAASLCAALTGCSPEPARPADAEPPIEATEPGSTGTGAPATAPTGDTAGEAARPGMGATTEAQLLSDTTGGTTAEHGFLGVVVTRDAVDVAAETPGRVERVAVRVGDTVARGDLLARLDTRDLEQQLGMSAASLKAAQAEVARTRSQLTEAQTRYQRRSHTPDLFSREELESAKMEEETAQATLEAAEARVSEQQAEVEQLRNRLQRTEIRAPFAGRVSVRYLDPGATVLTGTPVVRLLGTEELLVRFAVPPDAVEALHLGDPVEVEIEDTDERTSATIQQIAPEIDGPSQMVFVEARLDTPAESVGRIRSGLVARVFSAAMAAG